MAQRRRDAKLSGEQFYLTGKPCKHGHVVQRRTSDGSCCTCRNFINSVYRTKNLQKCREAVRNHYRKNPDYYKANATRWAENNPEKRQGISRQFKSSEKGKLLIYTNVAKRRSSKLMATPPWLTVADMVEIKEFYRLARHLTVSMGIKYVVDHIIPLKGVAVVGLHVPWNLQVITETDNILKSNRMEFDYD